MGETEPNVRRGDIVWLDVRDHNGFVKTRPAVVLARTEDIRPGQTFEVMAITTSFPDPPPQDHVPLPWHRARHPVTGLGARSAAVLSWVDEVRVEDVKSHVGEVPFRVMRHILARLGLPDT